MTAITKENTGKARRNRVWKQQVMCVGGCAVVFLIGFMCLGGGWSSGNGGGGSNDNRPRRLMGGGGGGNHHKHRRGNTNNHKKKHHQQGDPRRAQQQATDEEEGGGDDDVTEGGGEDDDESLFLDKILAGQAHLMGVYHDDAELQEALSSSGGKKPYGGVYGQFCQVDFNVHKQDPASGTSAMCFLFWYLLLVDV